MLAPIAGDVAGALSLPLLRRKGAGHAAVGQALSRAICLSRVLEGTPEGRLKTGGDWLTLIEPADPGWMGLTDLYFRLWRPLSPSSLSMRTPSGRVGNDHEHLLDRIHQKVDLGLHFAHGVRHFKGNAVPVADRLQIDNVG
jgi:hypothetical protein